MARIDMPVPTKKPKPGTITVVWVDLDLLTNPEDMNPPTPEGATMIPTVVGHPAWPGFMVKKWGGTGDGNKNNSKKGRQQRRRRSAKW